MYRLVQISVGVALGALVFVMPGCGSSPSSTGSSSSGLAPTDRALSEVAIGIAAGTAGSDDTSANVALRSRTPLEWIAEEFAFERVAYAAAGFACGAGGTWGGSVPSLTYTPPNCTITYGNGTTTTLAWSGGPWNVTFVIPTCVPANGYAGGLVGSGCPATSQALWSTPVPPAASSPITRTWTSPLGHAYVVTNDSGSGTLTGIINPQLPASPTAITCATACPAINSAAGTRTIIVAGTHLTGTLDGKANWDETVFTPPSSADTPALTITGSGANRIIVSGTLVVEHNLANTITMTVFNGPLAHMAGCAFPISGSVTTVVTDAKLTTATGGEEVAFTGTCGQAILTNADGSQQTLYLSLVL